MWFFKKKKIDYDHLISSLENGNEIDIKNLLWQSKKEDINYLPETIKLVQKLKKNNSLDNGLTIFKKIEKGNYELIIFNTAIQDSDLPYSPLIIDKTTSKIVGIILPFNELHYHLSNQDSSTIGELGIQWVKFVMENRSKK